MDNPSPHDVSQYIQTLKELKEILIVGNPWMPIYSAIAGGLIATIPNGLGKLWTRRSDRIALESSILAEIANIASMIRKRKYPEKLRAKHAEIIHLNQLPSNTPNKEGTTPQSHTITFSITVADGAFKIYKANLDKIGTINKKKLLKIVHFYSLVESLALDTKPEGVLASIGAEDHYEEFRKFLDDALRLADQLTQPMSFWQKFRRGIA